MEKTSVLELKNQILESLIERGEEDDQQALVNPRIESRLAVGYSQRSDGGYQLELRVQSGKGTAYRKAVTFKELAKQEANIEIIPRIEIPSKKAILEQAENKEPLRQNTRPLHIGLSIGHAKGGAGTLGAFVSDKNGKECILSNNHVLALMGQADLKDKIFQPGNPDQWPIMADDYVAELSNYPVIATDARNEADSAIAIMRAGVKHESNKIPKNMGFPMQGRMIKEADDLDSMLELLKKDEVVCKIGRTTGYTEGQIGAVFLDNVPVRTSIGNVVFDNVIQVNWESNAKAFSSPGDSGSLVFTKRGLVAVGLHFAGGVRRVEGKEVGVSYSCDIATVLNTHSASLLD
jgi:hypothetical protein